MKDNASAFDATAYDREIRRTLPYYDDLYAQVTDLVNALGRPQLHWLDAGCGTGKAAECALTSCDVARMVLCDPSVKMLRLAAENLAAYADRTECWNMPIQEMHAEGAFDVITSIQVSHYLHREERALAVANCYYALKPGGLFVTFENMAPHSETGVQLALKRWQSYQVKQGKPPAEVRAHIARYGAAYFPITLEEHLALLRSCGFRTVEPFWLSYLQLGLFGIK